MRSRRDFIGAAALCLIPCLFLCVGKTEVGPPSKSAIIGTWVAFDDYAVSFMRLSIGTNECRLASTYAKQPIKIYAPCSWTLNEGLLAFTATNTNGEVVQFKGACDFNRIKAQLAATNDAWVQNVTFFREKEITSRLEEIQKQMESSEKQGL